MFFLLSLYIQSVTSLMKLETCLNEEGEMELIVECCAVFACFFIGFYR